MPAANMTLSYGLFSLPAKVAKAIDDDSGFSNLCVGQPGHHKHDPSPQRQPATCDVCGPITDPTVLVKGQKQGTGTYAVVDAAEVEAAKEKYAGDYVKKLDLVPVPASDFLAGTIPGDKMNFVTPANVGDHNRYQLLVRLIESHPELAFVGLHAPRTSTALWRVTVTHGCLVMESRVKSDRLRQVPEIGGEVDEKHYAVAEASLEVFTQPWNPADYEDQYKETLRQMVVTAEVIHTGGAHVPTNGTDNQVIDLLAKAIAKAQVKKPAKKTTARKTTARKTTAKKTTTRKAS